MRTHSRSTIRRGAILIPLALAFLFTLPSRADLKYKPWIEKDWTQWTQNDCQELITKSPWACQTNADNLHDVLFILDSALPIREVGLRELQFKFQYNTMTADNKQGFDLAHAKDLDPIDRVKVTAVIPNINLEPPGPLSTKPPKNMGPFPPTQIALRLSDGTFVLPTQANKLENNSHSLTPFQNQFEYIFPRTVGGKPLYSPTDSFLVIELGAPLLEDPKSHELIPQDFRDSGERCKFKISDMVYKGRLEY